MKTQSSVPAISLGSKSHARTGSVLTGTLIMCVLLTSCHSSSKDDTPTDDPAGLPSPPGNLVGSAYSVSEIQLSWEPATDDGLITGYDIERDGASLATNLNTLSYLDSTVVAETTYSYSVFAVDDEGNRSNAATLSISSLDTTPVLNQSNYAIIVADVLDAYRGAAYDPDLLLQAAAYYKENDPTSTQYEYLDSGAVYRALHEFNCTNGGTASVIVIPYLSSDREVSTAFDDCRWNSAIYNGRVTWFWPPHNESQSSYRFDNLSIDAADYGRLSMDGSIGIDSAVIGSAVHQGDFHMWSSAVTSYARNDNELSSRVISETDTFFGYGRDRVNNPVATLSGSLALKSASSLNQRLLVTIPEDFISAESSDRYFPVGSLRITAEDGSEIQVDANGADPHIVSVSLTMLGVKQTFDEQWDTWYPNLTFEQVDE